MPWGTYRSDDFGVVEAFQLGDGTATSTPEWACAELYKTKRIYVIPHGCMNVLTPAGWRVAMPGDWILRRALSDELHVVAPEVFADKFERTDVQAPGVDYVTTAEAAKRAGEVLEAAARRAPPSKPVDTITVALDLDTRPALKALDELRAGIDDALGMKVFEPTRDLPDPAIYEEAVLQRNGWCESAAQFSRNEDYYRGLLDEIGEVLGGEAFLCDDGSRSDSVLRAKLPELVKRLICARDCLAEKLRHERQELDALRRPSRFLRTRMFYREKRDGLCLRLARLMPKRLRYWATIVSGAEASTGKWSHIEVPAMLFVDVIKRNEVA